ncbi:chromophore lyase CpcT/CpeT [Phormidium sp. CLA17]|uniref:chromophore lyase CpcT/CpeT n=1 Tax=Leptolyngbya sp. Cla-17 TaxID=2803751 RepID=UPI0014909A97|nr:chromophore lyase CpcT/CpeT [Leptolyngbya sp. Cla-17]MBM0743228.1 chromophore lyase CpcT/CpeT [Leptolyngbya sp. Cla-17]
MPFSPTLLSLASHIIGEFENAEQAAAEPIWYVHLRLWQRPVALFGEDSITLFAEQANITNLQNPYRQRLMRLQPASEPFHALQVQYYEFKKPTIVKGAGSDPDLLKSVTFEQINLLPGCILNVSLLEGDRFIAKTPVDTRCCFNYQGKARQVVLGFEASADKYLTYDKGVDLETNQALWGAMMGPYRYTKTQDYSHELMLKE